MGEETFKEALDLRQEQREAAKVKLEREASALEYLERAREEVREFNEQYHDRELDLDSYLSYLFSQVVSDKLKASAEKGRGGWDDPEQTTTDFLRQCLLDHIKKGDPVDVAAFAMMLYYRGASTI